MPRSSRPRSGDAWVLAGPAAALSRLEPLIEAHRARRPVRLVASLEAAASHLDGAAALLVVGEGTPGRSLSGVFVRAPRGARVPVGWLPDAGPRLEVFARAAAEVQDREGEGPFAILGELDARALALAAEVAETLGTPAFLWTAERLSRLGLIEALRCGPGVGLYLGHGLAGGWLGYGGFGRDAVARAAGGSPLGALLSVSCSTASRPRRGFSFCEEAALSGLCAAALGARRRTLHRTNAALGLACARAIDAAEPATLAELLLALPEPSGLLDRYRIVGDPLARLAGAPGAAVAAASVFAPAPDAVLPEVALSSWAAPSPQPSSRGRGGAPSPFGRGPG